MTADDIKKWRDACAQGAAFCSRLPDEWRGGMGAPEERWMLLDALLVPNLLLEIERLQDVLTLRKLQIYGSVWKAALRLYDVMRSGEDDSEPMDVLFRAVEAELAREET